MLALFFGIFKLMFSSAIFILAILSSLFWIWMLIECATREPNDGNEKIVWILVIVLTHLIGALIYFFVRRPRRIAEVGR